MDQYWRFIFLQLRYLLKKTPVKGVFKQTADEAKGMQTLTMKSPKNFFLVPKAGLLP
jgi:hypothetical protein